MGVTVDPAREPEITHTPARAQIGAELAGDGASVRCGGTSADDGDPRCHRSASRSPRQNNTAGAA